MRNGEFRETVDPMRDENQCLHGHAPLAFASHTLSSHFRISDPWVFDGLDQQRLCQSDGVETPQESGIEEDEHSWGLNRVWVKNCEDTRCAARFRL